MRKKLLPILALYALAAILSLAGAIGASAFTPEWASEATNRVYSVERGLRGVPPFPWKNWIGECERFNNHGSSNGQPIAWFSYRFGFPFRCAYSQATCKTALSHTMDFEMWYEATSLWEIKPFSEYPEDGPPQEQPEALSVATGILPLGLIANTLTLGTALLLVIVAIRAAIAHRRRRNGRCTKCGYQLIGLAANTPCPECGHASQSPHSAAT